MADLKSNKKLKLQYNGTDIVKLFTSVRKDEMGSFLKDKKERITKLLGQVENVNEVDPNDNNNTLLHIAASMGYQEIVELLVRRCLERS